MNLKFSGVGAEPKKLAALGVFMVVAAYFYFSNSTPGGDSGASTAPRSSGPVASAPVPLQKMPARPGPGVRTRAAQRGGGNFMEFRPSLKPKKDGEAGFDRASIDPTLRLARLKKMKDVKLEGGARSLFEFSTGQVATLNVPEPNKVAINKKPRMIWTVPPPPPPPVVAAKPPEPPPPPIALKFYGFINPKSAGIKRAFFLDGDEIIVATEGQLVKNRYKIVRIGVNSAVVEDTQFKNHQQTIPLVEEQTG